MPYRPRPITDASAGVVPGVGDIQPRHISPATGCSGLLIPQDGDYVIAVCAAEPQGRQNFSAAHEIVHVYFRGVCPAAIASTRRRGSAISALPC